MQDLRKYGSRKFLIALALVACATALGFYDKMDSGAIGLVFAIVGGGYGLVNYAEKRDVRNTE